MFASIRNVSIFFDIDGAGLVAAGSSMRARPSAFLVHGGPGFDHSGLKSRYGNLADRCQLVFFDHRGHGRSSRAPTETYTLDENVEDMEALRKHLGFERIVSIGTSYGGMVALAHAARYPASVSCLVLVATAHHCGIIDRAGQIVRERGSAEQVNACDELFAGKIDTQDKIVKYMNTMASLYSRNIDPALSEIGLSRSILSPDPMIMAFGPNGVLKKFDLRPELKNIVAPTLVLGGRGDWICAPEFSIDIARRISNSRLVIFEQSNHSLASDEPEKFSDVLKGFLAEVV